MPLPGDDAVRAHVDSILSSAGFANAERISRFLRYTVDMKLRGEERQIKEFLLGREVFDRGSDYDPRLDPIVRVEARRLRQRLAEYYEGPGRAEPVRIEFPKGSYAPVIQVAADARPPAGGIRGKALAAAAAVVLLVAGAAVVLLLRPRSDTATLAVIPARWVWEDREALDPADERLAEDVTARLANQGRVAVIGWPVVARRRGRSWELRALGRELGVDKVVLVAVRREGLQLRVTAYCLRPATGRKDGVYDFSTPALNDVSARGRLIAGIAAAVE